MNISSISFIEAGSPGLHIFSKFPIPRLGAVLLSTILRERGYEVKAFNEDVADPDWSFIENSDLVCISTITSIRARFLCRFRFTSLLDLDYGRKQGEWIPNECGIEALPVPMHGRSKSLSLTLHPLGMVVFKKI